MTTNNKTSQRLIPEEDITGLSIKELNKRLTDEKIPKIEQQSIKKLRRNSKMKKYRRESRSRKSNEYYSLLETLAQLKKEFFSLNVEVEILKRRKYWIISQIQNKYDSEDDNSEIKIV